MIEKRFFLQPFHIPSSLPDVKITGAISRRSNILFIQYEFIGNLEEVLILEPVAMPERKHSLWKRTCFEFFLAVKGSPQYWEFNLSPSLDWNVYRFEYYRQKEMKEEPAFMSLLFNVRTQPGSFLLDLELDLDKIVMIDQSLEIGISAVIQLRDSTLTYWALTHPGQKPDFHHRSSFIIEL
ncbi:MAG: DOMON-like domain-containing protein [Nitrospirae bacterium]|nr:DOMON-like domain-containing protein [Nitrospirota bacterium]